MGSLSWKRPWPFWNMLTHQPNLESVSCTCLATFALKTPMSLPKIKHYIYRLEFRSLSSLSFQAKRHVHNKQKKKKKKKKKKQTQIHCKVNVHIHHQRINPNPIRPHYNKQILYQCLWFHNHRLNKVLTMFVVKSNSFNNRSITVWSISCHELNRPNLGK